jgi:uncharacterized protein (TIGR00730 family)
MWPAKRLVWPHNWDEWSRLASMVWELLWQGRAWSLNNIIQRVKHPRVKGIQVFGSARPKPTGPLAEYYAVGVAVGQAIAQRGYFPVTGGGPGMMKAVMEGAAAQGGHTVGITVPIEQEVPAGSCMKEVMHALTFAERLHGWGGFNHRAGRILALPGGLGTDRECLSVLEEFAYGDHLSEHLLQKQIVLLDYNNFFTAKGALIDHIHFLIEQGFVSPSIFEVIRVTPSIEQALDWLTDEAIAWTRI